MLHDVTRCYRLLYGVTGCYTMLHRVTCCYTVLKGAKRWHMVFHGVTGFSRVWVHGVTRCYRVLRCVTGCYRLLHGVNGCYTVVHGVTWCYTALKGASWWYIKKQEICSAESPGILATLKDVSSPIWTILPRNSQPKKVRGCLTHQATDEIAQTLFCLVLSTSAYPRVTPVTHVAVLKAHFHPNGFARLCFCFEPLLLSNAVL